MHNINGICPKYPMRAAPKNVNRNGRDNKDQVPGGWWVKAWTRVIALWLTLTLEEIKLVCKPNPAKKKDNPKFQHQKQQYQRHLLHHCQQQELSASQNQWVWYEQRTKMWDLHWRDLSLPPGTGSWILQGADSSLHLEQRELPKCRFNVLAQFRDYLFKQVGSYLII